MFHKIKSIHTLPEYCLHVIFENGEEKIYDLKLLMSVRREFAILRTLPGLFGQAKVDTGGYRIGWNDELDLSCEELYENGQPIVKAINR